MPPTLSQRVRYHFDNLMSRGTGAQIGMLALATLVLICLTALLVILITPEASESFGLSVWWGLMHTLDSGAVGGDEGAWTFKFIMLGITIGGIFVLSALIGILTGGFGDMIQSLRKGRSLVVERGHTLILGWSSKMPSLLAELAEANANKRDACVVILADRDKVEMDEAVRDWLSGKRLRAVTRSGSPLSLDSLQIVNPAGARAIVILAPEGEDGGELEGNESDTVVLKALLAVNKAGSKGGAHVVAELSGEKTLEVARMVVGPSAALINTPSLISRLLVQTGRQSGLSVVYTELFDFGGDELYIQPEPKLAGKSFREALSAYEDSTLIGVVTSDGRVMTPPPFDRAMEAGDQVIAISRDDDTVVPNGRPGAIDEASLAAAAPHKTPAPERTLVLGDSVRLGLVLHELDGYVAAGSETVVVGDPAAGDGEEVVQAGAFQHMRTTFSPGDITDRKVLDGLAVTSFDHVLVLSETRGRTHEMADARTMITLLHLRDLLRRAGKTVPVTTEMLDSRNRELASVAEADDFIVSNALVSLVLSQVAENKHLVKVFDELLAPEGYEFYLKPASDYVRPGAAVDFYAIVEAAARRKEVAVGYRIMAQAQDAAHSYGVVLNPPKSGRVSLSALDRVVVLAEQ